MNATGQILAMLLTLLKQWEQVKNGNILICTVISVKEMELFLLIRKMKISRDASPDANAADKNQRQKHVIHIPYTLLSLLMFFV